MDLVGLFLTVMVILEPLGGPVSAAGCKCPRNNCP